MEIRWHLYLIVANCAVHCVAKPVSLNEVIATESQQKQVVHAESPKLKVPGSERVPLKKGLLEPLLALKKFKETEGRIPLGRKKSVLKYKKTFQITSPLKPKRLKYRLKNRQKRRNPSVKREIGGNEKLKKKLPLLRSLGMLFDNLLGPDSSESTELKRKRKRIRYYTDTSEILCPCSSKSNTRLEQEEKTNTSAETAGETPTATEAATETSYLTPTVHIRSFRQNKNHPVLLSRDTAGGRRNDYELCERNSPAHHGSFERDIPRNHGDSQPSPGNGSHEPDAEDDEEDTDGHSRHDASSVRHRGGIRRLSTHATTNHTKVDKREDSISEASASTEAKRHLESGGILDKLKRENQQQIRGIETESAELLPATLGGLRGILSADKVDIPESTARAKSQEVDINDHTGDQQLANGSSALAEEDKEVSAGHETVEHNIPTVRSVTSKKLPVVFIIDGYSVTRSKNGENKLKEKAIHIHSK